MSNYRRVYTPGATYFFTVVTGTRQPLFSNPEICQLLASALRQVRESRPFKTDAIVVLPDHLHCIWRLPEGDSDFSGRWREIKKYVSHRANLESAVWQRRFWEHRIRDEEDWRRHLDYIHFNPVKHGLVTNAQDWPWSSLKRCMAKGWYEEGWGRCEPAAIAEMEFE